MRACASGRGDSVLPGPPGCCGAKAVMSQTVLFMMSQQSWAVECCRTCSAVMRFPSPSFMTTVSEPSDE